MVEAHIQKLKDAGEYAAMSAEVKKLNLSGRYLMPLVWLSTGITNTRITHLPMKTLIGNSVSRRKSWEALVSVQLMVCHT